MSEEFDKEAEREKLREKLEKDEQKRQETQRMSELLLQGATMTNEHCGNCGDPLFRDGGETFCPTCGGGEAEQADGQPREQAARSQEPTERQPQQPAGQQDRQPPQQPPEQQDQQPQRPPEQQDRQPQQSTADPTSAEPERANGVQTTERVAGRRPEPTGEASTGKPSPAEASTAEDGPRAELQRAVSRAARKANEATDPRTAKRWLEASKEAAEALSALER